MSTNNVLNIYPTRFFIASPPTPPPGLPPDAFLNPDNTLIPSHQRPELHRHSFYCFFFFNPADKCWDHNNSHSQEREPSMRVSLRLQGGRFPQPRRTCRPPLCFPSLLDMKVEAAAPDQKTPRHLEGHPERNPRARSMAFFLPHCQRKDLHLWLFLAARLISFPFLITLSFRLATHAFIMSSVMSRF